MKTIVSWGAPLIAVILSVPSPKAGDLKPVVAAYAATAIQDTQLPNSDVIELSKNNVPCLVNDTKTSTLDRDKKDPLLLAWLKKQGLKNARNNSDQKWHNKQPVAPGRKPSKFGPVNRTNNRIQQPK